MNTIDPKMLDLCSPKKCVRSQLRALLPVGPVDASTGMISGQNPHLLKGLRVAMDYLPLFDLKHHAHCYNNAGVSGIYGGLIYNVTKDTLCLPEAKLMSRSEFDADYETNLKESLLSLVSGRD